MFLIFCIFCPISVLYIFLNNLIKPAMKLVIVAITIKCFFIAGSLESSLNYPNDILLNPKDDCGNVCGMINANNSDSKCGDPDKRNVTFLLFHDPQDMNEEQTGYNKTRYLECVDKCPDNLQIYNHSISLFCVKDVAQFARDTAKFKKKVDEDNKEHNDDTTVKKEQQDDEFDYTWWIIGGVNILIVICVIIGLILKRRSDNIDFVPARPIQRL